MINRIKRLSYSFDPRVDQAIFKDRLMIYKDIDPSFRRPVYSKLLKLDESEETILNKVDEIYSTKFKNSESFSEMMAMSLDELNNSDDPLILFAKETFDESMKYEKESEERGAKRQLLKSKFIGLLKKYYKSSNKQLYADANGTLRVTYGNVKAVSLKDGLTYEPFTRLEGIPEAHR